MPLWPSVPSGTARQIARHCAGLPIACAPRLPVPCLDPSAARSPPPSPSGAHPPLEIGKIDRDLQGIECTDTRHRLQKATDRVNSSLLLHRLIENRDLLAQLPPGDKQGTHDQGDIGSVVEQRFDPMIK